MKSLDPRQLFFVTICLFGAVNLTSMLPTVAQNSPSTPDSQLPPVSPTSPNSPTTPSSTPRTPNSSIPTNTTTPNSSQYPSSTTPNTQTRPTNSQYPNSTQYPNSRPNSTQYPNSRPNSTQYPNSTTPTTNPVRPNNSTTPNGSMMRSSTDSSLNAVDRQFAMKAAQSDMTEIQTSQLALKRSQNPQILSYARDMIQAHTDSTNKLKPIVARLGLAMPKTLGAENQALVNSLNGLSGAKFDRAYMDGQTRGHAKTQATYQTQLQRGQNSQLKAFANEILPVVSMHLQMARNLTAMR
jgi:putative membrane protein